MRYFSSKLLIGIVIGIAILLNARPTKTSKQHLNLVNYDLKAEFGWPVAFIFFWIESRVPPIISLSPVEPVLRPRLTPFAVDLWAESNNDFVDNENDGITISLGKTLIFVAWWGTTYWCLASCFQSGGFRFGLRQVILVQALAASAFFLMMFT